MFTCSICGEAFERPRWARWHLKEVHGVNGRKAWNYLIFGEPHDHRIARPLAAYT